MLEEMVMAVEVSPPIVLSEIVDYKYEDWRLIHVSLTRRNLWGKVGL